MANRKFFFALQVNDESDRWSIWNNIRVNIRRKFHFQSGKQGVHSINEEVPGQYSRSFHSLHRATCLSNRATRLAEDLNGRSVYARRACTIAWRACTRRPTPTRQATRAVVCASFFLCRVPRVFWWSPTPPRVLQIHSSDQQTIDIQISRYSTYILDILKICWVEESLCLSRPNEGWCCDPRRGYSLLKTATNFHNNAFKTFETCYHSIQSFLKTLPS